jgi:hypothetical protein
MLLRIDDVVSGIQKSGGGGGGPGAPNLDGPDENTVKFQALSDSSSLETLETADHDSDRIVFVEVFDR